MRSPAQPDLSSLADAARNAGPNLRELALSAAAQGFADARPARDSAASVRFQELALGLIPLVLDCALAKVAALLHQAPDAPVAVIRALSERLAGGENTVTDPALARAAARELSGRETRELAELGRDDVDDMLSRNGDTVLDGHALKILIERARSRRRLAQNLLARPEPNFPDRAHLYAHADGEARERIRRELAASPLAPSSPEPVLSDAVRRAAASGEVAELWGALTLALDLPAGEPVNIDDPAGQEVIALALRAAGLTADECLGALLRFDAALARSIPAIFHLAEIVRTTSPAVARQLVGAAPSAPRRQARPALSERRASAVLSARSAERPSARPSQPPARVLGWSARADHRSRSTTGPGRT